MRVRGSIVAAAVGDALGWPQEIRSGIVGGQKSRDVEPVPRFRDWERYAGTRFARYRETVAGGEYSDDTQLLLACARCCLAGSGWLSRLITVELPSWTLYQRGAGRAVLAATRAWASGFAPWQSRPSGRSGTDPVAAYFGAGANGVAMRIGPHVIITARSELGDLLVRVAADGITTHGHPRALVGAALHAVALRHALSWRGAPREISLLDSVCDESSWQDPDWLHAVLPAEWARIFTAVNGQSVSAAWAEAAAETRQLLRIARQSASDRSEHETLGALGCFDKSRNGAGTVSAVAAAYAATKTAGNPAAGLLLTAFAPKADTDTLSSMTASLLGALHGPTWLDDLAEAVQDSPYLATIAGQLASRAREPDTARRQPSRGSGPSFAGDSGKAKEIECFRDQLSASGEPVPGRFIDGRRIVACTRTRLPAAGQMSATRSRIGLEDGQHIIVDAVTRRA